MELSKYLVTVSGCIIGFKFFGLSLFIVMIFCYVILWLWDTFVRIRVERKHWQISSHQLEAWVLERLAKLIRIFILWLICSHISFLLTGSLSVGIGAIPLVFLAFFLMSEFISVIENNSLLEHKERDIVSKLLLKILKILFNFWIEKVKIKTKKAEEILS